MNFETILFSVLVLLLVSAILGLLLAVASKYLTVEQDERINKVIELLPGYNCGACGRAGCAAFGEALVTGEVNKVSGCKVIKPDKKQEIKDYLDSTPGADGSYAKVDL